MASDEQLERLLLRVENAAPPPADGHLTAEDARLYADDALDAERLAALDAHLERCAACTERLDQLMTISAAWDGPAGEARLSQIADRALRTATSIARFRTFVATLSPSAALPAAAAATHTIESADGLDHAAIEETPSGDLVIRLSTRRTELAGTNWRIEPFERTMRLEKVSSTEFGAEATIARAERSDIAAAVCVRIVAVADDAH